MIIELPDIEGTNVISIEVARKTRYDRTCHHQNIAIDYDLMDIQCKDCNQMINPVAWIGMMAEEWHRVNSLYEKHKKAAALYEEKSRTQCQHCKRLTKVNPPNRFDSRLRA